MSANKLAIIGTGGLGRETLWAFRGASDGDASDGEVVGFLTHEASEHGGEVAGVPVLGPEEWLLDHRDVSAVCCIGDPRARRRVTLALEGEGVRFANAIHPSALLSEWVELGSGCIVGARAVLTTQVRIADHVVIGVGAIVSHDVRVEEFATISPGVILTGAVQIGYGAELGAGATAVPGTRVGRGALVGAQAVVVDDVQPNCVAAGVPARRIRSFEGDRAL